MEEFLTEEWLQSTPSTLFEKVVSYWVSLKTTQSDGNANCSESFCFDGLPTSPILSTLGAILILNNGSPFTVLSIFTWVIILTRPLFVSLKSFWLDQQNISTNKPIQRKDLICLFTLKSNRQIHYYMFFGFVQYTFCLLLYVGHFFKTIKAPAHNDMSKRISVPSYSPKNILDVVLSPWYVMTFPTFTRIAYKHDFKSLTG